MRNIGFLAALPLVMTLFSQPCAGETTARKPGTKTKGSAAKATPTPAESKDADKAEETTPKSAKKKSPAVGPAKGASAKAELTPRPKKSPAPSETATPKPRKPIAADPPEAPGKRTPETEKSIIPETLEPAKSTEPAPSALPETPARADGHAPNATIEASALAEFSAQPLRVQTIIEAALALTKRQLTYAYGSADPASGGLDCSGTIYYLLRAHGFANVPRDSAGQYTWLRKAGTFRAVVGKSPTSFEFDELLPGDLMFWSGTYKVERDIPVTHVMLYLGTEKKTKKRVMFGASDGRTYDNVQRWGVSVFDFKMPRSDASGGSKTDFLGYGRIPGLRTAGVAPEIVRADSPPPATEAPADTDPAVDAAKDPATNAASTVPRKKTATKKASPRARGTTPPKRKS